MTFYDDKKRFYKYVKEVLQQSPDGVEEAEILYKINLEFGFGKGLLLKYLENLHKLGKISYGDGMIIWKTEANSKRE